MQELYETDERFSELKTILPPHAKCFVVAGGAYRGSKLQETMSAFQTVVFDGYSPNPKYEEIKAGVRLFQKNGCNCILAVGGGSAIDTAKCVKLYADKDPDSDFLLTEVSERAKAIPLIAVPTTAGTGAESTRYSILYKNGEKTTVAEAAGLPDVAMLWEGWLERLPQRQKVATMLDALCQAIESAWSVKSNDASLSLALMAIEKIAKFGDRYILDSYDPAVAKEIMRASNLAGQAIQITSTTAPHAMCYKITTLFGIPHGMAVALTLPCLWEKMLSEKKSNDPRGRAYNEETFRKIAAAYGCGTAEEAIAKFSRNLVRYGVKMPRPTEEQLEIMVNAVAIPKLSNHPAPLFKEDLKEIYKKSLGT
ncbi:MAG: phosphonoacetaldehyde reductase [Clostridia bacterium]|nr:phosphonoacetaldehyde reductase [Clostridia bacterium]